MEITGIRLQTLFERTRHLDSRECGLQQLSDLIRGYLSIQSMVQVLPHAGMEYGTPEQFSRRLSEFAGVLIRRLRGERLPGAEWCGLVSDVLDAAYACSDERLLQKALELVSERLYTGGELSLSAVSHTENVRLLCCCYNHVCETDCLDLARAVIASWCEKQDGQGVWRGISLSEATARLSAIDLFGAVSCEDIFERHERLGADYYVSQLERSVQGDVSVRETGTAIRQLLSVCGYAQRPGVFDRAVTSLDTLVSRGPGDLHIFYFSVLSSYLFEKLYYDTKQRWVEYVPS